MTSWIIVGERAIDKFVVLRDPRLPRAVAPYTTAPKLPAVSWELSRSGIFGGLRRLSKKKERKRKNYGSSILLEKRNGLLAALLVYGIINGRPGTVCGGLRN